MARIEQIRVENKLSKPAMAKLGKCSIAMYYRYENKTKIPFDVVANILHGLGYKLLVVDGFSLDWV